MEVEAEVGLMLFVSCLQLQDGRIDGSQPVCIPGMPSYFKPPVEFGWGELGCQIFAHISDEYQPAAMMEVEVEFGVHGVFPLPTMGWIGREDRCMGAGLQSLKGLNALKMSQANFR